MFYAILAALLLFSGCASYPERWDQGAYRVIVASPEQVSEHCQNRIAKTGATYDNGAPVNPSDEIRACCDYKTPGKPTVFVSKKWRRCARHEAAHVMYPYDPARVAREFPCLGE